MPWICLFSFSTFQFHFLFILWVILSFFLYYLHTALNFIFCICYIPVIFPFLSFPYYSCVSFGICLYQLVPL
jgi:hypothetical protein